MTEEEAKTKLCPMSYNDEMSPHNCLGSDCMAWRIGTPETETMKAYYSEFKTNDLLKARGLGIDIDDGPNWKYKFTGTDEFGRYDLWYRLPAGSENHVHGYCGLAGTP